MSNKVEDKVLDHDFDGIQEYDNPLPRWWLMLFYGCIAFAVVYIPYYHFGPGPLMQEEYAAEMEAANKALTAHAAEEAKQEAAAPKEDWSKFEQDQARVAAGKEVFATRCAACHLADGGGSVGPNLTDNHWKNGRGDMASLVKIIKKGVPGTAMVAWESQLSKDELINSAVFVRSLKGTKPAVAKAPEGDLVED
ncbi:MAG: c-type cytochrome [Myxococcales bacterium]|nr:c-type cytochrome [Myxococcales bacterium]MCB9523624.1 c-type cytochrome [Myxococcales bacterium]